MLAQFVGKPFWIVLGSLAGVFALGILAFHSGFAPVALVLISLGVFCLTLKRLEWGIAATFAELFANSHGHLLAMDLGGFRLSLRMAVFLAVMAAWAILILFKKVKFSFGDARWHPFIPLFFAIAVGFAGGIAGHDVRKAFQDGNAYFYLAYLFPVLSVSWNAVKQRMLLQVLAASAAWVTLVTLGLLYVFTHFPEWVLGPVYTFIRDTRTGELTKMPDTNLFRIFLQAQFSAIIFAFLLAPLLWLKAMVARERAWTTAVLAGLAAVIFISLSRSFWVGIAAGVFVFLAFLALAVRPSLKRAGAGAALSVAAGIGGILLLVGIILFPLPNRFGSTGALSSLFSSRTTDATDVAVSSRWKLLPPMWELIAKKPILGQGFGQEVEFQTDDPRARAFSPDGTWRTYALEWGWLELWLKMGILGPIGFLLVFGSLARGLIPYLKEERAWLALGFMASLTALYIIHTFSPYLNHPLGLGFLVFLLAFLKQKTPSQEDVPESEPTSGLAESVRIQPSVSPLMSE
ncbi:O-antigen ligase family protein [Candidatus Uhrbacteria bacterium]|nr:O-antigen ligase family protein [Candidatus Uhrbacteria bacterium]